MYQYTPLSLQWRRCRDIKFRQASRFLRLAGAGPSYMLTNTPDRTAVANVLANPSARAPGQAKVALPYEQGPKGVALLQGGTRQRDPGPHHPASSMPQPSPNKVASDSIARSSGVGRTPLGAHARGQTKGGAGVGGNEQMQHRIRVFCLHQPTPRWYCRRYRCQRLARDAGPRRVPSVERPPSVCSTATCTRVCVRPALPCAHADGPHWRLPQACPALSLSSPQSQNTALSPSQGSALSPAARAT